MAKKIFNRGVSDVSKSFRVTKEMETAIEKIAEMEGETFNTVVRMLLDEGLQLRAEAGTIPWPKGLEPKAVVTKKR